MFVFNIFQWNHCIWPIYIYLVFFQLTQGRIVWAPSVAFGGFGPLFFFLNASSEWRSLLQFLIVFYFYLCTCHHIFEKTKCWNYSFLFPNLLATFTIIYDANVDIQMKYFVFKCKVKCQILLYGMMFSSSYDLKIILTISSSIQKHFEIADSLSYKLTTKWRVVMLLPIRCPSCHQMLLSCQMLLSDVLFMEKKQHQQSQTVRLNYIDTLEVLFFSVRFWFS